MVYSSIFIQSAGMTGAFQRSSSEAASASVSLSYGLVLLRTMTKGFFSAWSSDMTRASAGS